MNSDSRLILASKSPRRYQLLRDCGFEFDTFSLDVEESYPSSMPVGDIARFLSEKKNRAYRAEFDQEVILTADTTVVYGDRLLEKPGDASEANDMIRELSGRVHHVISGVTISDKVQAKSFSETTEVTFKALTKEEITYYVQQYQPLDKAGGYGIQEWIGLMGVSGLRGSYFNVMGLPTKAVYEVLTRDFNIWPAGMR